MATSVADRELASSVAAESEPTRRFTSDMLRFVVIVPTLVSLSDKFLLDRSMRESHAPGIWVPVIYAAGNWVSLTYAWFCIQTAIIAWYVGRRLCQSKWWWAILAWTMLLIDLQVLALAGTDGSWWGQGRVLSYSFAAAQAGLVMVATILGSADWRLRMVLFLAGLGWSIGFGYALQQDGMFITLLGQCLAMTLFCLVMRTIGFRLDSPAPMQATVGLEGRSQFSIQHLFYWTTAVAFLATLMRSIDLGSTFLYLQLRDIPLAIWYTSILSAVTVIGAWSALGRERWQWRLGLLLVLLPLFGAVCGYFNPSIRGGRWSIFVHWFDRSDSVLSWLLWCSLSGWFLAGILLVFRANGQRLIRRANKRTALG